MLIFIRQIQPIFILNGFAPYRTRFETKAKGNSGMAHLLNVWQNIGRFVVQVQKIDRIVKKTSLRREPKNIQTE